MITYRFFLGKRWTQFWRSQIFFKWVGGYPPTSGVSFRKNVDFLPNSGYLNVLKWGWSRKPRTSEICRVWIISFWYPEQRFFLDGEPSEAPFCKGHRAPIQRVPPFCLDARPRLVELYKNTLTVVFSEFGKVPPLWNSCRHFVVPHILTGMCADYNLQTGEHRQHPWWICKGYEYS